MGGDSNVRWRLLGVAAVLSAVALYWAFAGRIAPCAIGQTDEYLQKTVAALDITIELELKLSVALIGGGIALLLGLKSGVEMSPYSRTALLIAIMLFAESALLGTWWRLGLANAWFNKCLNIVAGDMLQRTFNWSLYFFLAGLAAALAMLIMAVTQRRE